MNNSAAPIIHPSALVDDVSGIGPGTRIGHWVHVSAGARIGARCTLGQNVFVSARAVLGNNVQVHHAVAIVDDVTLEDDVFCGPGVVFTNLINPRSHVPRKHEFLATTVRTGASIGANATILCGLTVGRYAFIGAGTVVTRNVLPFALMTGVPARRAGWVCRCGVKLPVHGADGTVICRGCLTRYVIDEDGCREG